MPDPARARFLGSLTDEHVVFGLSAAGVTALELGVPLAEAREASH